MDKQAYGRLKAGLHEFLNLLMNAHNLLMLFQRKSLSLSLQAAAFLSCSTSLKQLLHYSGVRYNVSNVRYLYTAAVCFCFRCLCGELIFKDLMNPPAPQPHTHTINSIISPCCSAHQPTISSEKLTQTTLSVPLETRCSEIRKDPFHTSAASRDKETVRQREVGGRED